MVMGIVRQRSVCVSARGASGGAVRRDVLAMRTPSCDCLDLRLRPFTNSPLIHIGYNQKGNRQISLPYDEIIKADEIDVFEVN